MSNEAKRFTLVHDRYQVCICYNHEGQEQRDHYECAMTKEDAFRVARAALNRKSVHATEVFDQMARKGARGHWRFEVGA